MSEPDFRKDFPILQDPKFIYFDNAATSQRPQQVLDAVERFYRTENANPLRGLYKWSIDATEDYEEARRKVAGFIGAEDPCEIVFTRNATESLNLVAYSYGMSRVTEGDEIVVSITEHHSNILPWQMVARAKGAKLVMAVDVKKLGADFFAFSGHKLLSPMGIGVLYGREKLLDEMPPFLTGGEMIEYVTRDSATYAELPHKFEAGTVNAAGAVGLGAAIDYISKVGFDYIEKKELALTTLLLQEMKKDPHITVYGSDDPARHCGIVTFNIEGCHPHDVSSILDADNVCIRAGHHCAQPLLQYLGVNATCRASMYFYNTEDEVRRFAASLGKVREELGYGS